MIKKIFIKTDFGKLFYINESKDIVELLKKGIYQEWTEFEKETHFDEWSRVSKLIDVLIKKDYPEGIHYIQPTISELLSVNLKWFPEVYLICTNYASQSVTNSVD